MSWLTPLGFLGLIGLIILILIYILKPNYQQKIISSTFVWKLSLKYRKKKIPISKLRNILLFICQVLVITACALILAQPAILSNTYKDGEKIVIIDASGSMLAASSGETRFARAVNQVKELAEEVARDEDLISVIVAGKRASYLVQRSSADNISELHAMLNNLIDPSDVKCSFGEADIDGAMALAEDILIENPNAEVILYSGTKYLDVGNVTVKDVRGYDEWNAGILDCTVELIENKYSFTVQVATYGRDMDLFVSMQVNGFNGDQNSTQTFESTSIRCISGEPAKYTFNVDNTALIHEYSNVIFEIMDVTDNYMHDNTYYLYGGKKPELRIQYASSKPNNFYSGFLMVIRSELSKRWDIELYEPKPTEKPEVEGFDLYVFEHEAMPEELPEDGVVWLINPMFNIKDSGIDLKKYEQGNFVAKAGETHSITTGMLFDIQFTQYTKLEHDGSFQELAYIGEDPILLIKNEVDSKVAVLPFSVNMSTHSLNPHFSLLLLRMLNYFIPSTITDYVYEVDEVVTLNARGVALNVSGEEIQETFTSFPATLTLSRPGAYTLKQTALDGRELIESFYVKIPASQSNILKEEDILTNPYIEQVTEEDYLDLLVWFAATLVLLLFFERWLQTRELF